jgi:hypothetical protein
MPLDPLHGIHPSHEARCVFAYLHRRGGSIRLGPLLRGLGMDQRIVVNALNDLKERYWIIIVWRKAATGSADEDTRPLAEIDRVCTTRFGRRKYRSSWPID